MWKVVLYYEDQTALSQMEAEAKWAYAGIWVDNDGFIAEGPNMNVAFVLMVVRSLWCHGLITLWVGVRTPRERLHSLNSFVSKGMLKSVRIMDMTVEDGKKAYEDGKKAYEMMLLGSGVLVKPVIQWDEEVIADGKEGPS